MPAPLHPRLIRPERDGQVGGWSYLFKAIGEEFIFPALVEEMDRLKSLILGNLVKDKPAEPPPDDPAWATKVIYWKASEWEQKFLPLAVEWTRKHGFAMPDVPYNTMEFRKIEDRDGEERVTEVINVSRMPDGWDVIPAIMVHQFKSIDGEEAESKKPLLQWWSEGVIDFDRDDISMRAYWSVPRACRRMADWAVISDFVKQKIEKHGPARFFEVLSYSRGDDELDDEGLRAVTIWIAFCLYINSMKTRYVDGPEGSSVHRRKSQPRTLDEAVAIEQATILKSAGILKSGVRRRKVLNPGSGTKHRYRYLVRGHERVINGKSIWVKPQIRGDGEFMVLPTATDAQLQQAIPETPVTVNVPQGIVQAEPMLALPSPRPLLLAAPKPVRQAPTRGILAALRQFFSGLLLRRR